MVMDRGGNKRTGLTGHFAGEWCFRQKESAPCPASASSACAFEKGQRLARLVGQRRSLLILDGLEPLQYAPTAPTPGELKDQGLAALLKGLAAASHGLCIVTTRYSLPDLRAFWQTTAPEVKLLRLSRDAGVHLLKTLGVKGSDLRNIELKNGDGKIELVSEFEKLVEDVKGHALTLQLLATFLRDAHDGDIRHRNLVKLAEADAEEQGGHAFRVMEAYEREFEREGDKGRRALAILRLLGLFDRPATADCLEALWSGEVIAGLTDPLIGISEAQRNLALRRLEDARLIAAARDAAHRLVSIDAHPLLREFFAQRLRHGPGWSPGFSPSGKGATTATHTQPPEAKLVGVPASAGPQSPDAPDQGEGGLRTSEPPEGGTPTNAWRAAHRRLYEHLCASTKEGDQPTLEDLQPLYQAVAHGCQAGLQQEADEKVYFARIKRGEEAYSSRKLGAFGSDLGAIACFFEQPWSRVSSALPAGIQAWYLSDAAFRLRALGRLTESLEPMRASLELAARQQDWKNAAIRASNLSELELTLGEVAGAVGDAEQSVTYADRSCDASMRMIMRTTHADALHQAGRRAEAETRFREAEQMQQEMQPAYPLLYSLRGFRYCDLLLAAPERAAWQSSHHAPRDERETAVTGKSVDTSQPAIDADAEAPLAEREGYLATCRAVSQRAAQTLKWVTDAKMSLLTLALDHLTLGRAALYAAILQGRAGSPLPAADALAPPDAPPRPDTQRRARSDAPYLDTARRELDAAVAGLRRAGQQFLCVSGLLTRAWLRFLTGARTGPESAQADLDEAWEIAERGPMRLHMADVLLTRARLFGCRRLEVGSRNQAPISSTSDFPRPTSNLPYPWESAEEDLAEARRLIEKYGYGRRMPELEDAEAARLPSRSAR
ncbi:MAG: hypothetical protein K1X78_16890 [Verrucomicrobiaceae bacterium]|nr:hypothetical protein [Verrucomicrobiaceae bacterium]